MILLGLLLVAAAAVIGTEVVISNTQTTEAEAFTETMADVTAGEFFLAGAGCALLLSLGLLLITSAIGRARARRAKAKHVVAQKDNEIKSTESELSSLADENERLRRELEQERRDRLTMGGAAVPPMAAGMAYDTETYDVTGRGADQPSVIDLNQDVDETVHTDSGRRGG